MFTVIQQKQLLGTSQPMSKKHIVLDIFLLRSVICQWCVQLKAFRKNVCRACINNSTHIQTQEYSTVFYTSVICITAFQRTHWSKAGAQQIFQIPFKLSLKASTKNIFSIRQLQKQSNKFRPHLGIGNGVGCILCYQPVFVKKNALEVRWMWTNAGVASWFMACSVQTFFLCFAKNMGYCHRLDIF